MHFQVSDTNQEPYTRKGPGTELPLNRAKTAISYAIAYCQHTSHLHLTYQLYPVEMRCRLYTDLASAVSKFVITQSLTVHVHEEMSLGALLPGRRAATRPPRRVGPGEYRERQVSRLSILRTQLYADGLVTSVV